MAIEFDAADGVGAYVRSVNLAEVDAASVDILRAGLGEYGVLYFREQSLSPEQHLRLAESFGPININRFFSAINGYPGIAQVLKEPEQKTNIGGVWHTDHSYDQIPALGSILVARELPNKGGDTLFVNMAAAYEALPDEMKQTILPLKALHSSRHVFGDAAYTDDYSKDLKGRFGNTKNATQDAIHPLVIQYPISKKPVLYVNPQFTVQVEGMAKPDSDALLESLYAHALQEQFQHRLKWQDGSVVFWDNRASWHSAENDYQGERRLMHRITVEGEALKALSKML